MTSRTRLANRSETWHKPDR